MAIYDNDGTTAYEIGKVYDNDGTANHQIGKVYDYDGTVNSLIYTATKSIYPDTDGVGLTFNEVQDSINGNLTLWFNTGSVVNRYSNKPFDTTGFTKLVFVVADVGTYADRWVNAGLGNKQGDPNVAYVGVASSAGTYKLDISNYQGAYYLCMRGRYAPNIQFSAIYLE